MMRRPPRSPLFPYTPLFRSEHAVGARDARESLDRCVRDAEQDPRRGAQHHPVVLDRPAHAPAHDQQPAEPEQADRKSTRLNSSHSQISYAVFCLKKKNKCTLTSGATVTPGRSSQRLFERVVDDQVAQESLLPPIGVWLP